MYIYIYNYIIIYIYTSHISDRDGMGTRYRQEVCEAQGFQRTYGLGFTAHFGAIKDSLRLKSENLVSIEKVAGTFHVAFQDFAGKTS